MNFIMYVCVASHWFCVPGIHSTDTIFFVTWSRGEGRPCRIMLCRLSVRRALVDRNLPTGLLEGGGGNNPPQVSASLFILYTIVPVPSKMKASKKKPLIYVAKYHRAS